VTELSAAAWAWVSCITTWSCRTHLRPAVHGGGLEEDARRGITTLESRWAVEPRSSPSEACATLSTTRGLRALPGKCFARPYHAVQ